ncbi:MAG: hypothetical protein CL910_17455 [Deltaproteobacteria bacterium]|jgi:hypothetical protein|nr:hypothetical protein [Deltaproteobacteria bacterium]
MSDQATEFARGAGPLPRGRYRVVVLSPGDRHSCTDFRRLAAARDHADDAAAEWSEAPILAYVLDHDFEIVHRGRPYFAGQD